MERDQTRRTLLARPDVPDADVDDILDIAARRQDDDRRAREGATTAEIEAVARELDIDPSYVEGAVNELRRSRAEAARAGVAASEARSANVRKVGILAGLILVGFLGSLGLVGGAAWMGSGAVHDAEAAAHGAEARLDVVLQRQAALAPSLVSLAGGQGSALVDLAGRVRAAEGVESRIDAANALSIEMASAIAALPPPAAEADSTLRLQLYDEISGGQNRITTEQRRYEEAMAAWRDASTGGLGGLAVGFGLAEGPE